MTARLPLAMKKTPEQRREILRTAWARGDRQRQRSAQTKAQWAAGRATARGIATRANAARATLARAMRAAGRRDALNGVPLW